MSRQINLSPNQFLALYETTKNQFEQANRQTELLRQYIVSLKQSRQALQELIKNNDKEFYVDVGNQTFVPVKNTGKKARIDLGLGVYTETSFEKAVKKLSEKIVQAEKAFDSISRQTSVLGKNLVELELQLQKLSKK